METGAINKLLNVTLKHKFPKIVNEVIVNEKEIGPMMYYLHVFVLLNRYQDIIYDKEIKKYIKEISKYSFEIEGNVINQVSFGLKE